MRLPVQFAIFALAAVAMAEAQNASQPPSRPAAHPVHRKHKPVSVVNAAPTPVPAAPIPVPVLEQPPSPATIQLSTGKLSVNAANSSLTAILRDISTKTGMSIEGLSKDKRIFGVYGPAAPGEVLSALLDGAGYNILMIGRLGNGAPRQLVLSPRTGVPVAGASRQTVARPVNNNDDDSSDDQQDPNMPQQVPPEQNQPPVQEQAQPPQAPVTPPGQNGVRTPQQMLQEIQQMRQQQMQQQQQQPQQ